MTEYVSELNYYIRIGMLSVKTPIWVFWQDLTSL